MRWKKGKPEHDGIYWVKRYGAEVPRLIEVRRDIVMRPGAVAGELLSQYDLDAWAGPITPPPAWTDPAEEDAHPTLDEQIADTASFGGKGISVSIPYALAEVLHVAVLELGEPRFVVDPGITGLSHVLGGNPVDDALMTVTVLPGNEHAEQPVAESRRLARHLADVLNAAHRVGVLAREQLDRANDGGGG